MPPSQTVEDLADLAMESENATNVTFDVNTIKTDNEIELVGNQD